MNSRSRIYVALLFSIGIGDGRRLLMADWRTMMEEIGLNQPRTLIATGNAVFATHETSARRLESRLEEAFKQRFGCPVDTIVRTAAAFRRMLKENPFPEESARNGSRVLVRIMREPLADVAVELKHYLTQGECIQVVRGDLWVHFQEDSNRSRLMPVLGSKRLGIGKVRNWNTVRRLGAMVEPS